MSGLSRSVPSSPGERERAKQGQHMAHSGGAASARDLVGKVLREQGLGKICDDDFISATRAEMQEAMHLTDDQFEAAARQLLEIDSSSPLVVTNCPPSTPLVVTNCPPSTPLVLTPGGPPSTCLTPVAAHRSPSSDISNGLSDTHL